MPGLVVVGCQWGDEGKGKIVDLLCSRAAVVVRFQGGANAGHTIVVSGRRLVLHLVPSGVLHPGVTCVIGPGVVVDPEALLAEIRDLAAAGVLGDPSRIVLDRRCHVVMPYHKGLDSLREKSLGSRRIGTTGRGIGPAYEDMAGRRGVRIADLAHPDRLRSALQPVLAEKNALLCQMGAEPFDPDDLASRCADWGRLLLPHLGSASAVIATALARGDRVLFEGAQGALLDVLHGTYPYVTSSSTIAGAACAGSGVGPTSVSGVLGVTKAYATRVGEGPFPTELRGEDGERLRSLGAEYGATTGRPRRTGWLDMVALRHACRLSGVGALAVTKLDVLSGVKPLRVCTGYRAGSVAVDGLPPDASDLQSVEPVYEEFDGFDGDLRNARSLGDLPEGARRYIAVIEERAGVPLAMVSVGSERESLITLREVFP